MRGDYLWDRSGRPDPEVEALERLLGPLRHGVRSCISAPCTSDPVVAPAQDAEMQDLTPQGGSRWRPAVIPLALAAAVALLVAGTWVARPDPAAMRTAAAPAGSWTFEPVSGTARLASEPIASQVRVPTDRWLETGPGASARLSAGDVGTLRIGPLSRLRLVRDAPGAHRLALARGSLDAFIWASPRQFFIETPSAVAVNLGCAYRLEVDEDGTGRLRVTLGWVGFEWDGRESLVPSGAVCTTRPGRGPGTPHFEDATPAFREGAGRDRPGRRAGRHRRRSTASCARPARATPSRCGTSSTRFDARRPSRVYDRLAVARPAACRRPRERVLAGDRAALDAWWDSLARTGFRFREWIDHR